jgi:predicted transcriptional regulator
MRAALAYPDVPGAKRNGTSTDAAFDMRPRAPTLRTQVLILLAQGAKTADECAEIMGKTVLAIRPRLSELVKQGLIHDTGDTRENISGVRATVWAAGEMRQRPTSIINASV